MQKINNTPKIDEEKTVINRAAIEHRAIWMGYTYEAAKQAGVDGEALARTGIARTGCLHGADFKEKCKEPLHVGEFADVFLPPLVRDTFEMDVKTCREDALEIEFHYCPLVAGWLKAGIPLEEIPTLCDVAMDGDRNIAKTMGLTFSLGKTIANGDDVCEVCFYKKKQD